MKKILAITSLLFLLLVAVLPQNAVQAASAYSATVTINGKDYKVNSVNNAIVVNIDDLEKQYNLKETDKVEKITIETPNGAKSLTGMGAGALLLPDTAIPVVGNKVELVVAELLGDLDSQQDGVALSTVREFLYPVNNKVMGQAEVDLGTKKETLTLVLSATKLLNVSKGTPVNVDSFSLTANGKVLTATKAKTGTNKFDINLAGFGIEDLLESIKLTSNTATTVSVFSRDSAFYSDVTDVKFANHVATLDREKVTNWAANLGITVPSEAVLPVFMLNTVLTGSGITTLNGVVADDNGNQSPFSVTIQQYGWVQIDGVWYYILKNGEKAVGWNNIGGTWYLFHAKTGAMQTGWVSDGGKWYFLSESGAMQTGWVKDEGKWYSLDKKSGAMQTGWVKVGANYYYFDEKSGAMYVGLLKDGKNYILGSSGAWLSGNGWVKDGQDWYYLVNDSAKLGWNKIGKTWYYFNPATGKMVTGWTSVNGVWYFMSKDGAMVTGWAKVDGEWYYLKASGAMATGWVKVSNKWYYLYSNGKMAHDTVIDGYKLDSNGAWIK